MGTLRMLLALSVMYAHTGRFLGISLVSADAAVQTFYAISGFYMALVLNEKYRRGNASYPRFVCSRFVRLFPTYITVLLALLALAFVVSRYFSRDLPFLAAWRSMPALGMVDMIFLVCSQAFMLGLDFYVLLAFKHGSLSLTPNFLADPNSIYKLLVIPPAWTLGIELSFYLIAPFILRRPIYVLAGLLVCSLCLRLTLQFFFGLSGDPWSYRFFPSELALFLLGAIGYRAYRSLSDAGDLRLTAVYIVLCILVAAVLLVNRWRGWPSIESVGSLLLFLLAVPHLFRLTRNSATDRLLGDLSFPVYVGHALVIWGVDGFSILDVGVGRGCVIFAVTLALAGALYWSIDRPMDSWRHKRFGP